MHKTMLKRQGSADGPDLISFFIVGMVRWMLDTSQIICKYHSHIHTAQLDYSILNSRGEKNCVASSVMDNGEML